MFFAVNFVFGFILVGVVLLLLFLSFVWLFILFFLVNAAPFGGFAQVTLCMAMREGRYLRVIQVRPSYGEAPQRE